MIKVKSTYILSGIIAILMFVASFGGLVIDNLYRDKSVFILSAWYGNDLVTLFVALPLFVGALFFYIKGSLKGHLILLGMLEYSIYNFAFYLFGAAFNYFFPIYVALFVLSVITIILGVIQLDFSNVKEAIKGKKYFRFVSIYMFFMAGGLGCAWLGQWAAFVLYDKIPEVMLATGGTNNLIAILDLSFVVSIGIIAAVWLWKSKVFGYILAVIFNIKGAVYTIVLIVGCFTQGQSGVSNAYDLLPLWLIFFFGCLFSTLYLLKNKYHYKIQLNRR